MDPRQTSQQNQGKIIRILSKDLEGNSTIYSGLTKIKGVSWGFSNAICKSLGINKKRKIESFTHEEIKKIEEFIKNPKVPEYLMNRRNDLETGETKHLQGTDLELRKDFDVKRLKQIRSYRGLRHTLGLPMRGQRTKSNFRRNRKKGSGIKSRVAKKSETGGMKK
jgi:small subunit ribosomal protein S13